VHAPLTGAETVSVVAVMAPVAPAVPTARAHCPTAIADGPVICVVVNVVVPVSVTVPVDVACVRGLVSWTVTVDPLTAVTCPVAAPNEPPRNPPGGRVPVPGVPAGRPPRPARVQTPFTGWVTDTEVAVIGPPNGAPVVEVAVEAGVPNAEMQDPTVIAEAEAVVICRIVVAAV